MKEYQRILIPTDGSKGAELAAVKGVSLAKLIDAEVVALFVMDHEPATGLPEGERLSLGRSFLKDEGRKALEFTEEETKKQGVHYLGIAVEGSAATRIVEIAREERCDLIVMGTKGRSGLAHLLIGSVAELVIRNAHCPVFVVRETPT